MKILLIGKENILNWLLHMQMAISSFENLKVEVIKTNHLGFFNDISRNLFKLISKKLSNKITRDYIEAKINSFKPDLIIAISPFLLTYEMLVALDVSNATKVAWIGDKFGENHKKIAKLFDLLYCTDTGFLDLANRYNFPKSKYLPLAFNDDIFKFKKEPIKNDNLVFVGAYTPQRADMINRLICDNIEVYGPTWNKKLTSNIKIYNKKIDIYSLSDLYNNSKFVLNPKHEFNVINGLNMRTFESIACGSCLLQDNVKDTKLNFDTEKEIVSYDSIDELNDKICSLKKDKKLYNSILKAGHRRVCANHTYKHRVSAILKDIS